MYLENCDIFYRVLDRELPKSIDGAKRLLREDRGRSGERENYEWHAIESFKDPLKDGFASNTELTRDQKGAQALLALRDQLGCLATAFEISDFEPFVSRANAVLGDLQSRGLAGFGDSNFYSNGRFPEKLAKSYHFDRLVIVEIVLAVSKLEKSMQIGASRLRSFRGLIQARLDRTRRLSDRMMQCENLRETLAWALHYAVYARYLNERGLFDRINSICQSNILPEARAQANALFFGEGEASSAKSIGEWIEVYFTLVHWLSIGARPDCDSEDLEIESIVEKCIPVWGDACDGQGYAVSPEFVNLLGSPSMALLLGIISGDAHFIQLWEDLSLIGGADTSCRCSIMNYPLLWLPAGEYAGYKSAVERRFFDRTKFRR